MKRIVLIVLLLAAVVAGAIIYRNHAHPAPKAADLLAESTLLFVDIPDIAKSRSEFHDTALAALLREPEVEAFLEKPLRALKELTGKGLDPTARDLILDAMQGEVFLAVTKVLPTLQASVVFGADVKAKRVQTEAALFAVGERLRKEFPKGRFEKKSHLGIDYSVWELRDGYAVCYASLHSLIVFTLGEDTMDDVIARFQKKAPPASSLGASAKFHGVVDRTPAAREFLAYVNIEEVTGLISPFMMLAPSGAGTMRKLARLQATGTSFTFTDGGVQDVGVINLKNADPDLPGPDPRATLAFTSPQTILYMTGSGNLATEYDQAMGQLAQAGVPALTDGATKFERTIRSRGVRLREDVLAHLSPETALLAAWRDGARFPDVALVIALSDAEETRPGLDVVMNALKEVTLGDDTAAPWEESQHSGHTLRTVHIGAGLVAPTYATTDKFFVLALTPDYARELLDQVTGNKPTLMANAEYQKAAARFPAQAVSYTYCDLRAAFEPLYALAQSGIASVGTNEFADLDKLPKAGTVSKHLFPYSSATVVDGVNVTTTTFSPFGNPVVMLGGIALGAAAIIPNLPPSLLMSGAPRMSSDTDVPAPAPENQTEESGTPVPQ